MQAMESMINTNLAIILTLHTKKANANLNAEPLWHKTEWLESLSAKICVACRMRLAIRH